MNLKRILENNGFNVKKIDRKYWEISQYTPAGEDWCYEIYKLNDFLEFAKNYDPEEDFAHWMEARCNGYNGVPKPSELWQDQLWKQEILNKVIEESEE